MNALRLETEEANAKIEELQNRVKLLEQENLAKDQDNASLTYRNNLLDGEVEKLEKALADSKTAADTGAAHGTEVDALTRKVQLLEEDAEETDKNLRETNEKLRQTDVKAEHYERKVATVEAERDAWEKKYEEIYEKYKEAQEELDKITKQLDEM